MVRRGIQLGHALVGPLAARREPRGGGRRVFSLALILVALLSARCADDPAVAPLLGSGGFAVELRMVDGTLAPPAASRLTGAGTSSSASLAPCDPPPSGFPEDVVVEIALVVEEQDAGTYSFDIPARSGPQALAVEGVAPRSGYVAEVTVRGASGRLFEGTSAPFAVASGGRTLVGTDLLPVNRRAVLALGAATTASDTLLVPVLLSQSLPLRGLEFELCFDPEVIEPAGARAVGSRVGSFRGAAGEPGQPGILRAVLWSPDPDIPLDPGRDQVLEIRFVFRPEAPPQVLSSLVFLSALATDAAEGQPFTVYFFDGQVQR